MSLAPQHIDSTPTIVYLAKRPCYEFALIRPMPTSPGPSPEPPLVQLQFIAQPHQPRIQLTLAAIEEFHSALSRLLDYVKQERARRTAIPSSDPSMEGPRVPISEGLDDGTERAYPEGHHPVARLIRPASTEWLCSVSGIVLVGLVALLSLTLYSLSVGKSESRPMPPVVQETSVERSEAALSQGNPPRGQVTVHQTPLNGHANIVHTSDGATNSPAQSERRRSSASVPSSPATTRADAAPHISLHIQSSAQHTVAQRLATQLQQKGYIVPKEAKLVAKGPSRTEVRYFHTEETDEAAAIAMLLHQAYRPPATVSYMRGRKDALQSRARHYEIWLGPEPR